MKTILFLILTVGFVPASFAENFVSKIADDQGRHLVVVLNDEPDQGGWHRVTDAEFDEMGAEMLAAWNPKGTIIHESKSKQELNERFCSGLTDAPFKSVRFNYSTSENPETPHFGRRVEQITFPKDATHPQQAGPYAITAVWCK